MSEHHPPPPANFRELFHRLTTPIRELFNEPLPRGVGWFHTTGSMCAFMAVLQIVTGILMAFYYTASPDVAYESIKYVEERVAFGKIIHGLHHWGSSAFVVMAVIHMLRVFSFAAYKGPRKWTWIIGVFLFGVVMGFGFTGYLLPWDMKAYFGTQVGTNIVGYTPVIGPYARHFLLGGSEISEVTIPRFYSLHTLVLPAALIALMGTHLYLVRLFGITPPFIREGDSTDYPTKFFPQQAVRDSTMILILFSIVLTLAATVGADLGEKADPNNTTFAPHPEWYFLGLQQLLRYFTGKYQIIGTFVIPVGFFLGMILLPFVDRSPERKINSRPLGMGIAIVSFVAIVALTIQGYLHLQVERRDLALATEKMKLAAARTTPTPTPAPSAGGATTVASAGGFTQDDIDLGETLYTVLSCEKCHADKKAGTKLNIPPSLEYAGDRFKPEWISKYMQEVPLRRYEKENKRPLSRMPDYKLKEDELKGIAAYLNTLHKAELFEGGPKEFNQSTQEKVDLGKKLYGSESCNQCHPLNGEGTKNAPDLTGVGSRLKPLFIYQVIKKPQTIIPETAMQNSLLNDQEVEALTYYMLSLQ